MLCVALRRVGERNKTKNSSGPSGLSKKPLEIEVFCFLLSLFEWHIISNMKKVVKAPKNIDKDTERYLGALNEMHGQTLKTINENFVLVNNKLDLHSKILNSHTEMIGTLMEDVSFLKSDMVIVKEDVATIKSDLKKKVDYDDFLSLVRRVQKLEARI